MASEYFDLDGALQGLRDCRLPSPAVRRRIREGAGLSCREMAGILGVSHGTVERWEQGRSLTRTNARKYRQLLDALQEEFAS